MERRQETGPKAENGEDISNNGTGQNNKRAYTKQWIVIVLCLSTY